MPQWQGAGYEKPKFHPPHHFAQVSRDRSLLLLLSLSDNHVHSSQELGEHGPFRAYWCFPWEAYLQPLKRMFDACNWVSPPYSVCCAWATKSVLHYRDPKRAAWVDNSVEASSDFIMHNIGESQPHVVQAIVGTSAAGEVLSSYRYLERVKRGAEDVQLGDLLLIEQLDASPKVARVDALVQAVFCITRADVRQYESCIRIWCTDAYVVELDDDCTVRRDVDAKGGCMLVRLELVQVTVVVSRMALDGKRHVVVYA